MQDCYRELLDAAAVYYRQHGRHDLPWRLPEADGSFDPYKILVSELMLQQTQVSRVVPKYEAFLQRFPIVSEIARAPLGDVLVAWQGLGYNRRAKFLWQIAQKIVSDFGGQLPNDQQALESLPGIGANTAGAIRTYAFNEPAVFIETNIRTVYVHHYFKNETNISDHAIRDALHKTVLQLGKSSTWFTEDEFGLIPTGSNERPTERVSYRLFYWALMDYGSHLKQSVGNLSRASKAYAKQSTFAGSARQLRGRVLRLLAAGSLSEAALLDELRDARAPKILTELAAEGLIQKMNSGYKLP